MKRILLAFIGATLIATVVSVKVSAQTEAPTTGYRDGIKTAINKHLGRPYVWGAAGLKSFDCSGFVWRIMFENGVLVKRTTARKFFLTLPKATPAEQGNFGTLIFFDDLKHVGIVDDSKAFYHAQVSRGTNRSNMTPFWERKIYGYRKLPIPAKQ
jgi:cell wall-associated NlpC family hydrolase